MINGSHGRGWEGLNHWCRASPSLASLSCRVCSRHLVHIFPPLTKWNVLYIYIYVYECLYYIWCVFVCLFVWSAGHKRIRSLHLSKTKLVLAWRTASLSLHCGRSLSSSHILCSQLCSYSHLPSHLFSSAVNITLLLRTSTSEECGQHDIIFVELQ